MRHVIAAVGGEAERQLGQVARAEVDASHLARDREQDHLARPGLHVLEGDVLDAVVVPDGCEHRVRQLADADLAQGGTERAHERTRGRVGPRRGPEPRHGDADHVLARQADQVGRVDRDQQRLGRVPSARNAEHHPPSVGRQRAQPLGERGCLDEEDLVTAMITLGPIGGHEGQGIHVAAQRVVGGAVPRVGHRLERYAAQRSRVRGGVLPEGVLPHAVGGQRREVDVCHRRRARQREALRLRHQLTAIGNEPVPVPRQIGARLPEARGAVELHGEVLRRRHAHEIATVLPLADRDVGGRQIRQHGGAGERRQRARRHRRPEVLAHLGVEREAVEMRQDDEHVGAERDPAPEQLDGVRARRGRGLEPAWLVELAVAGQVRLRGHRDGAAAVERDGAVVEAAVQQERRADRDDEVPRRGRSRQVGERVEHAAQERLLEEEVAAGVGRQPQLGADGVLGPVLVDSGQGAHVGVGVEGRVRHADLGDAHADAREAVPANV